MPPTGRLLGILSHFDEGKGQDFVIEVLHHLRSRLGYNTSLVIMGEPTRNEGDAPTCGSYIGKWLGWICSAKCISVASGSILPCYTN